MRGVEFRFAPLRQQSALLPYYQRSSRPISLADAILLASAQPGDRIATSDPNVLAVAAARGLDPVPLLGEG